MAHWLIVGPYPPEQGSGSAAARAAVVERLAAHDTVHAVSPRPSAAHDHRPLDGVRAMWALAALARAQHADALWVRIEPGILLRAGTDRGQALLERLALAVLLRRFTTSVLDVGEVGLLPGGRAGRPVFEAVTRLVTHDDAATAALLANGAPPAKVVSGEPWAAPTSEWSRSTAAQGAPVVEVPEPVGLRSLPARRHDIEAAVRARGEQLHAARATGDASVVDGTAEPS